MEPIHVMAVDDSSLSRQIIGLMLASDRQIDFTASVGTAEEAWATLQSHDIDVITLDLHLPDTDGLKLVESLTREACGVVVVSGDAEQHGLAMQLGATACFEKLTLLNEQGRFVAAIRDAAGMGDGPRWSMVH